MYKFVVLSLFIILFSLSLNAQTEDVSFQNGFVAFEEEKYEEAVKILALMIENEDSIHEIHLPKTHFYLALAYRKVAQNLEIRDLYPEALLRAYNHLRAVKYLDKEKEYVNLSEKTISLLWPEVYNEGVRSYNNQQYDRAVIFFAKVRQINPRHFHAPLNQGYAHWLLGDTLAAIRSWEKATQLYQSIGRRKSEISVAKSYGIMAEAYSERGIPDKAIVVLKEGQSFFPSYALFKDIELAIYLKHPEFMDLGEEKLKERIQVEPKNHNLKLVYGSLLAKNNQENLANDLYLTILSEEPKHYEANLRLATFYINKAYKLEQNKSDKTAVDSQLSLSIPYLENLYELQPSNQEWVKQLATAYSYLNHPKQDRYLRLLEKVDK